MNITKKIAAAAAALVILCGCAGTKAMVGDPAIIGTYELTEVSSSDAQGVTREELQQLKDYGMTCTLEVKEDNTAVMDLFGDKQELKWDAENFYMEDSPAPYRFDGSEILIEDESKGGMLVFERIASEEEPAAEGQTEITEETEGSLEEPAAEPAFTEEETENAEAAPENAEQPAEQEQGEGE